ncbi:MAG: tetratricopeptide repeat protein [Planctomycetaceae bacterium]
MMRTRRLLTWILILELVVTGGLVIRRTSRSDPPRIDAEQLVDSITDDDFRRLEDAARDGGGREWRELATAYAVYGFFPDAEACCRHAAQLDPSSFEIHYLWGIVLNRLGRMAESNDRLQRAIVLGTPRQGNDCWYLVGRNLLRMESAQEAEAAFRKAAPLPRARYHLAFLLARQENLDEALPLIERLQAEQPEIHTFHQLRARVEATRGNEQAAIKFRQLAEQSPEDLGTDTAADFLAEQTPRFGIDRKIVETGTILQRGDLGGAIANLEEVLEASFRPRVARLLARLQMQNRRPGEAGKILRRLIEEHGGTPDDRKALDRVDSGSRQP